MAEVPVLIAGGGLVGLCAAAFLHSHGVPALTVERHTGTLALPRARVVNVRSMELFRSLGLEQAIRAAPRSVFADRPLSIRARTLAGPERARMPRQPEGAAAEWSPGGPAFIDQNVLEPLVRAHLEAAGADLRFGTRLVSFTIGDDGATALLADARSGETCSVRCRYVIAADGHRSGIRDTLGIDMTGETIARFVTVIFRADLTGPLAARAISLAYLDEPAPGTLLTPFDGDGSWVLMVPFRSESGDAAESFDGDRCLRLIDAAIGRPVDAELLLPRSAPVLGWELAARVAETYRRGPVFLVGDAAHVMPPAGGFGANTGIADVHNLAWKLAAVLRGSAGAALLDSYDAERRPVAEATCAYSAGLLRARHDGAADGRAVADPVTIALGYRYHADGPDFRSPGELHGEIGTRAPHLVLERDGESISTLDLFGPDWVVLTESAEVAAAVRARAIEAVCIGTDVRDVTGRWANAFDIEPGGAVLVRPDGFVGWRLPGPVADAGAVIAAVRARLSMRPH
ncbi:FAD-dependent monooxygenase [Nocardia sp. NPDC020380]|uniref:FAD-dependent monooxygenase n=1 Tax=Nocardia sp. NPDC020380 TaxID=3364309 RepID=UPI0037A6CCF3